MILHFLFTLFGEKITNSDVVLIYIDRIASQCSNFEVIEFKKSEDKKITERNKDHSFY